MRSFFIALLAIFTVSNISYAGLPVPDIRGQVESVMVLSSSNGINTFRIYLSSFDRDRWSCIANSGGSYMEVTTSSQYVNENSFKQMYSMALAAKAQNKKIAMDSPSDCKPHTMWIVD